MIEIPVQKKQRVDTEFNSQGWGHIQSLIEGSDITLVNKFNNLYTGFVYFGTPP